MLNSKYKPMEKAPLPPFTGTRIMMMPVRLGTLAGVPPHYVDTCQALYRCMDKTHVGSVGYLTIDEQNLGAGETLRRRGRHVDGYYQGRCDAWGGGGSWGSLGNGMLTLSSTKHCRVYVGTYDADPGLEGECDHVDVGPGVTLDAGRVHWLDGSCIHESLPVEKPTRRQFVRLSLPSNGPWFEGYTHNPAGIMPSAKILPPRAF